MRLLALVLSFCAFGIAHAQADTFGGFSSLEPSYLVNQDRVCALVPVRDGAASGAARCERKPADRLAQLAFRAATAQRGPKALFSARAEGNQLTVLRAGGDQAVRWQALDPIAKIIEVYAEHDDRVAVAFSVRRGGRELIDVIAFDLRAAATAPTLPGPPDPPPPSAQPPASPPSPPPSAPKQSPALEQALTAARKARGKAALAAWRKVLELDAGHAEALFRQAVALAPKDRAGALAALAALASSRAPDAIEYQVAARLEPAFAALRAEAAFRKAVGLDRKPTHPYEKAMGFGGAWEQAGTSCDAPKVELSLGRDKKFRLTVRTVCEGMVHQSKFAGTWAVASDGVALTLPNRGAAADVVACTFEPAGDEDALACPLDDDLRIFVLPVRR